ncbi:helix-turn-helix domain-containing protein [Saccharomonospora sp. NPDC006951]
MRDAAVIGSAARRDLAPVASGLMARSSDVARHILEQVQQQIPEYSRPIEGLFGKAIVDGVEQGVLEFLRRLLQPETARDNTAELFRLLGKYEVSEGRGIDVLHSACRVGARVGWQALSDFGQRAGLPVSTMCELADALFAYIDELSALSHEGYTAAKAREAGALERRRKRLLDELLGEPGLPVGVLAERAEAAAWPLPPQVAVVVLAQRNGTETGTAIGGPHAPPELAEDILVDLESDHPCLIVPSGSRGARWAELCEKLPGWRMTAGPFVSPGSARDSLRWARQAAALVEAGVLADEPVTDCADHLVTLWLLSDPALARQLVDEAMAPLEGLSDKQRERLADTLAAWLETRGGAPDIAGRLGVHPQTVRYRLHQLDELYGDKLTLTQGRFALTIALRARELLRGQLT